MNTVRNTSLTQCCEDVKKEITQLKLELRDQIIAKKQIRTIDDMKAFMDDYEKIKRVSRYAI